MKKDDVNEKSLADVNPELAKEWHSSKNGDLKPSGISAFSNKEVWWYLPYDDPETGKHFDFEWKAAVSSRNLGAGCPFLSGKAVWLGFNDLATVDPELAKQWHPYRNGDLKPTDVTAGSSKKVWWILPYDDSNTGRHFDFEWQASIFNRRKGQGCPYLSGRAVWPGFNDLQTVNPELAKEWHSIRNENMKPSDVTGTSGKKVWWRVPCVDPKTGEHFDYEWKAAIEKRAKGTGAPFLSGKGVISGVNDLATINPKLALEWHPSKNGDLKPSDVTAHSSRSVWWMYPYDDPKTGKHFDFTWKETVDKRMSGNGCPFLSGKRIWKGFNDLESLNPEVASQWDSDANNPYSLSEVFAYSNKKYSWVYDFDDPVTGKHFRFKWKATAASRMKNGGCPFLSGNRVWPGYNDLKTLNPELALQWDYEENDDRRPEQFTPKSRERVSWVYSYNDPNTGKHYDFRWKARICDRNEDIGCPFLSGNAVWSGFNDLRTTHPELAMEWDYEKNNKLTPEKVSAGSNLKVWWICPECGKSWRCQISHRVNGQNCNHNQGNTDK